MNDDNGNDSRAKQGLAAIGKGILSVLKESANEKIAETKTSFLDVGEGLLDKLLLHIRYIAFLIVAATLVLFGAVLGLADAFQIPTWSTALGIGIMTYILGALWKKKNLPPKKETAVDPSIAPPVQ